MKIKRLYWELRRHWSNLLFRIRRRFNLPDPVDFEYVDIVFENCNWVRVPSRLIDFVFIGDVRKDIWTTFCQQYHVEDYCKEFSITIKNNALNIKTDFQTGCKNDYRSSFENHLKEYQDITHIEIKPSKKKGLYIGVPYDSDSDCGVNKHQKTTFENETFTIDIKEKNRSKNGRQP